MPGQSPALPGSDEDPFEQLVGGLISARTREETTLAALPHRLPQTYWIESNERLVLFGTIDMWAGRIASSVGLPTSGRTAVESAGRGAELDADLPEQVRLMFGE